MTRREPPAVSLPKDAVLIELRSDRLTLETRQCLLPGTELPFRLLMERQTLPIRLPVKECLVVAKDRAGYQYHLRLDPSGLPEPDRRVIRLFIQKGRGAPQLLPA